MRRLLAEFEASERHVCELLQIPRSTCRYRSRRDDSDLREQLQAAQVALELVAVSVVIDVSASRLVRCGA